MWLHSLSEWGLYSIGRIRILWALSRDIFADSTAKYFCGPFFSRSRGPNKSALVSPKSVNHIVALYSIIIRHCFFLFIRFELYSPKFTSSKKLSLRFFMFKLHNNKKASAIWSLLNRSQEVATVNLFSLNQ